MRVRARARGKRWRAHRCAQGDQRVWGGTDVSSPSSDGKMESCFNALTRSFTAAAPPTTRWPTATDHADPAPPLCHGSGEEAAGVPCGRTAMTVASASIADLAFNAMLSDTCCCTSASNEAEAQQTYALATAACHRSYPTCGEVCKGCGMRVSRLQGVRRRRRSRRSRKREVLL